MNNNFILLRNALLSGLMILSISCADEYTEEDALKAQQTIDLTIYVVDGTSGQDNPIEGATVTVSQGGQTIETITDALGVALFPDFSVGSFVYSIKADGYLFMSNTGDAFVDNLRVGQITQQAHLISMKDENLATIKGNLTVDTDVTNLTKEAAAGVEVDFDVYFDGKYHTFSTTTDENGDYEIKLPTNGVNGSTGISIRYADFEADQTIAVNKFEDEEGSFPAILPRIETVSTLFSSSTDGAQNRYFYENNVRSVYAIADEAPEGGITAKISAVSFSDGQVTGVDVSKGGDYIDDEDGIVTIKIYSLDGGSDASIEITLGDQTDLYSAYYEYGTAETIINSGSGYPDDDFLMNKIDYRSPNLTDYVSVQAGDIKVLNGDFGTGIYRARQVQ